MVRPCQTSRAVVNSPPPILFYHEVPGSRVCHCPVYPNSSASALNNAVEFDCECTKLIPQYEHEEKEHPNERYSIRK